MRTCFIPILLLFSAFLAAQAPRLIVPVGHSGTVTAAALSPDSKYLLTGSTDQTAILWSIDGKELHTFKGHSAGIRAVGFLYTDTEKFALTGDGNGHVIRWSLSGQELQELHNSPGYRHGDDWVEDMYFSSDGTSVCLKARNYEEYIDIRTETAVAPFEKAATRTPPPGVPTDGPLVFSGAYCLTMEGSRTHLYDQAGNKIRTFAGFASPVQSVAFCPVDSGKTLLTLNANGVACLWDLENGQVNPDIARATGAVTSLAFAPDSREILVAGYDGKARLLDWRGSVIREYGGGGSAVFSPDGKVVLTGAENGVQLWDRHSGKALQLIKTTDENTFGGVRGGMFLPAPSGIDPARRRISTGASVLKIWDPESPQAPVKTLRIKDEDGFMFQAAPGSIEYTPDGKSVMTTTGEAEVVRFALDTGQPIDTFTGHHERILALDAAQGTGNRMFILTGSADNTAKLWDPANNVVKQYSMMARQLGDPIGSDLIGGEIQTYRGHVNDVHAVAFSPDGIDGPQYVLTGSADNTAKLWDRVSGAELATLISLGATDWVVTVPSGLFDASPGAMQLLHYVVGTEVIDLEQLKERYYEPGLLQKVVGLGSGTLRDVSALGQVALYPEVDAQVREDQLQIGLKARSGGMGKLSLFINDKEVAEDLNPDRKTDLTVELLDYVKYYLPGENTLTLRAYNKAGWLKSQALELKYVPSVTGRGTDGNSNRRQTLGGAKPHLYAIVVGTSQYSSQQLTLRFPDRDAAAIAQALQAAGSRLFEDRVHLTLLTTASTHADSISSKTNIEAAFRAVAEQALPTDVLVAYFSGHGLAYGSAEKSQFYYLTKDIVSTDLKDEAVRQNFTVSSEDLTRWLTAIPARKQVMILDACNSGKLVENLAVVGARELNSSQIRALDRMKDRTGMFILTGAAADKISYEASQYGQGLLTYSLLQGMSGLALTPDKRVDVMTLFQYARDQVPVLAKGVRQVQIPMMAFPDGGGSFDIGIVDAGVKIPVTQPKPVFIRNNFQDGQNFDDGLGLTQALAEHFQRITARGAQANLIYVDVSAYENAYSIKGLYSIDGNKVTVEGRLFRGKDAQGKFQVEGQADDVAGLVEAIVKKVMGMMNGE